MIRLGYGKTVADNSGHTLSLAPRTTLGRKLANSAIYVLAAFATIATVFPLLHIIYIVVVNSLPALSPAIFTKTTSGVGGGLSNAIAGTILIAALALVLAAPLGIMGGVYLNEFAPPRIAGPLRIMANVLTGVPSIVIGYFGYVAIIAWLGWGYSLLAAGIAIAMIMLPFVLRASELALSKVPASLREASLALGATATTTVVKVVIPAAAPGILTGLALATGLGMGETAPLIYTAGWSDYMPTLQLTHAPVAYLTYVVWAFINEPFAYSHALAYAAALLLIILVLIFNVFLRFYLERKAIRW